MVAFKISEIGEGAFQRFELDIGLDQPIVERIMANGGNSQHLKLQRDLKDFGIILVFSDRNHLKEKEIISLVAGIS